MGYATLLATCLVCRGPFVCNPVRVPSFRVDGVREPVCRTCMELVNRKRVENGLDPFAIPEDAYEACDELELA